MDALKLFRRIGRSTLAVLGTFAVNCGSHQKEGSSYTDTDSVKALESDLNSIEASLSEKKERLRDLEMRIQGYEEMMDAIQGAAQPSLQSQHLDELQEAQESLFLQTQKDRLLGQISKQEQVVASKQQLLALTVAPDESEWVVRRRFELEQAQRDLEALKNQVSDLYVLQQEQAVQKFIERSERLNATYAEKSELYGAIQMAQSDLEKFMQEREKMRAEISSEERKSEQLGQEREVKIQLRREAEDPH